MTAKVCALVEFERTEFALKAVRELNDMPPKEEPKSESSEDEEKDNDENEKCNMLVMELTAPPPKTTKNEEDKNKANRFVGSGRTMLNKNQPSYSVGQALPTTRRFSHAGFGQQQQQLHQQHGRENSMNAGSNINQHNSFVTTSEDLGPRRRISLYHNMKFTPIAEESSPPPPGRKHSHQREMGLNPNAPTFTMCP